VDGTNVYYNGTNVGIGTTNPVNLLDIRSVGTPTVDIGHISNSQNPVSQTTGVDALAIEYSQATDGTAITGSALDITVTPSGDTGDTIRALTLNNVTPGNSHETGLYVGTGYDADIEFSDSTPTISIAEGSVLGVSDGTNQLFSLKDSGSYGTFYIAPKGTSGDPASCSAGDIYVNSADATVKACTAANTWEALDGGGGGCTSCNTTLSPEFAGASFTASNSAAINGTMTSEIGTSATGWQSYYQWTSAQTSLQDYTIAVRIKLPTNFSSWKATGLTVNFVTQSNISTDNKVDVVIYNDTDTPGEIVASKSTQVSATGGTWSTIQFTSTNLDDGVAPDWDAAGETAILLIRLYSKDSNYVRIGDIGLDFNGQ
jgi:hypothetical protein